MLLIAQLNTPTRARSCVSSGRPVLGDSRGPRHSKLGPVGGECESRWHLRWVMEDEVWGQYEEAKTFMSLEHITVRCREGTKCTSSKALHFGLQAREIRDRVCTC